MCLFAGLLRIVSPFKAEPTSNEESSEDKASSGVGSSGAHNNILLEKQFPDPILQLAIGSLTSSGSGGDPKLAVLHPRLLSIYSLQRQKGKSSGHDSYGLLLQYQHKLSRSAYGLVTGPFGRSKRDFLCVQSLDGTLNVFEQESYSFSRFLPGFLLPGPLAYVERTDSFVTLSSSYQLECYRYQTMAVASDSTDKVSDNLSKGKRIIADWNVGIGESANALNIIPSENKDVPSKIILVGHRTIHAILDTGVVMFVRKLDFSPLCSLAYLNPVNSERVMSLMASDTDTLLIYDNTSLKWAAQLPFQPLAIRKGKFKETADSKAVKMDLLVLISKKGDIFVSYLGTDPTIFSAPAAKNAREVNYEESDQEYLELTNKIREASTTATTFDEVRPKDLEVTVSVEGSLEKTFFDSEVSDPDGLPMARIKVVLNTTTPLSKVRITLDMDPPLALTQNTFIVNSLSDKETLWAQAYLQGSAVPHTLDVSVNAVYSSSQGYPQVQHQQLRLPLQLVLKSCPPIKDAEYKVTLSTNKPAVSLLDLFPEFNLDATMANAAGFQYYGGPYVTLLSSKTSQRYRLQSDDLPALWIITKELEERLQRHHQGQQGSAALQCTYSSSLPIHEYFTEIESHFYKRTKRSQLSAQLAQRATQFRSIERRLLARFKDKTPSPLTNLDTLLDGTYRQIMLVVDALEESGRDLARSGAKLTCITHLLLLLARLSTGMTQADLGKLRSALSPVLQAEQAQGWEETTDAALTFLLRTSLAKPGKENQGATPITLEPPPKDVTRLKKHISSVLDRIAKGGRIQDNRNAMEQTDLLDVSNVSAIRGADNDDNEGFEIVGQAVPKSENIGSRIGEASERLMSARSRSRRSNNDSNP